MAHVRVAKWLRMLQADGVIRCVREGTRFKAAEYVWVPFERDKARARYAKATIKPKIKRLSLDD